MSARERSAPPAWQVFVQWAIVGLTVWAWARACTIQGFPAWAVAFGGFAIGVAGYLSHVALRRGYASRGD